MAVVRTARPRFAPEHGLGQRPFLLGLTTGVVHFAGTLYWLVDVMAIYGGLSVPVACGVAALLVAYLALFPAAFAAIVALLARRMGPAAALLAPAVWVTTELGRTYLWDGFPWALLGTSQATVLPVAQAASVVGVYGVSFVVVMGSAAAAYAACGRRARAPVVALALACLAGIAGWGRWRLEASSLLTTGEPVVVGLVQGNFAQDVKWDPAMAPTIVERYVTLTEQAIASGARLVVWPESALPFYFAQTPLEAARVRELARKGGIYLLFGSDEIEAAPPDDAGDNRVRLYNSAFLLKPDGKVGAVYRKIQLVPFGEYVPARRLLFFAAPLVEAVSGFSAGERHVTLPVDGHVASTAICYEVVYPGLMRRFVGEGSELLTTITNDAWFGRSSAAYQHFEQAMMRAVEEGRYLVRAANTGISGVVDPYGRVLASTRLFDTAVLVEEVRYLRARTVYSRVGDLMAYLSLALTVLAVVAVRRPAGDRRRR